MATPGVSGMTWIMGADRAQAAACYDGCGPRRLGVISERFGTPVAIDFCSGALASLGFGGHRLQFELSQLIPLVLFVQIGIGFYAAGTKTRTRMVTVRMAEHDQELGAVAPA